MPVDGLLSGKRFEERELAAIRKGRADAIDRAITDERSIT